MPKHAKRSRAVLRGKHNLAGMQQKVSYCSARRLPVAERARAHADQHVTLHLHLGAPGQLSNVTFCTYARQHMTFYTYVRHYVTFCTYAI